MVRFMISLEISCEKALKFAKLWASRRNKIIKFTKTKERRGVFVIFKKLIAHNAGLDRVAKLYLGTEFLSSLYFAWPIFYGFATQAITPAQVGIFFSALGIIQFAAEIPTGVVADRYSRKLSGIIGTVIALIAPLIIYFGHNFPAYLVAAFFYGIGRAFLSGSLDSLVYDHKNVSKESFRRVSALDVTFSQAAGITSAAAGGLLFALHPSLPFLAEAIAGIMCLALILLMREDRRNDYTAPTSSYVKHFGMGIKYLLATNYLRIVVLMGVIFAVMLRLCIQFVNEATMIEHGMQPATRGLLIASASVVTLIILNMILLRALKNDRSKILFMGFGAAIAFALMSINITFVFLGAYLLWSLLIATQGPFTRPLIHEGLPSSHRSTAMSGYSALTSFVAFGGSSLIGVFVQWTHTPRAAYMLFAGISLVVLLPCTFWLARHLKTNP
jgi:MFS family permease